MKQRAPFHKERFQEDLKSKLNIFLRREIHDPKLQFVSITKVECSKDLAYADVFWDTFQLDQKEAIEHDLQKLQRKMRAYLANRLNVRHTPALSLKFDGQFESEMYMTQLLEKTRTSSPQ